MKKLVISLMHMSCTFNPKWNEKYNRAVLNWLVSETNAIKNKQTKNFTSVFAHTTVLDECFSLILLI